MRRRTLVQLTAAGGVLPWLPGCLWGESSAQAGNGATIGTNLSGMEWTKVGIRRTAGSLPNINFTVPRRSEIAWLAAQGFRRNRLPVLWEMLQPVLHDTRPNAQAQALVGAPGEFHAAYAQAITDVLDAHAAAKATCLLDLHNYCRYRDFRWQPDGSVPGLRKPETPLHRAHTEDPNGTHERIFSLAPGATLTQAHFTDFWRRAAERWKGHPGLAGYGLMNEPHDLPRPGSVEESSGGGEDLAIWPTYARAAVEAIRAVDRTTPIYVAGNEWSSAMAMATRNPGFPLPGGHLVYEVHLYLDARSSGHSFDFEEEVRKGYSAGVGGRPIDLDTGVQRLAMAVEWAKAHKLRLALTEVGMPVDDPRWLQMFQRTVQYALRHGVEVYSWMGGSHWPIRSFAIQHVPRWHQHRTLQPAVAGPMLQAAGIARATLHDDGPGWSAPGQPVQVTVHARGHLAAPLALRVAADAGAQVEPATVTLPAGANTSASFTVRPVAGRVTTVTYAGPKDTEPPPPRRIHALADPVAHAARDLPAAAHAILARLGASKWEMAHGHTDYVGGAPAADGQPVRAVADSGFGSRVDNPMEMVVFLNNERPSAGFMAPPVMRTVQGRKALDHAGRETWGLWCKKAAPEPGVRPRPLDRAPYDLQDPHFVVAAIRVPGPNAGGVVFQASRAEEGQASELVLEDGRAQARWTDGNAPPLVLAAREPLDPGRPAVLTLACGPGEQVLRVDGQSVAQGRAQLPPAVFAQMLIGWGFQRYYPRGGFGGQVFAVIAGKGRPADAELAVLERYLASLAA
jgi:hypothetical protein